MDYFYTSLDGTHYIEEPTVPLDNTSFDKDMPIFLNCAENQHSNMYGRYVKKITVNITGKDRSYGDLNKIMWNDVKGKETVGKDRFIVDISYMDDHEGCNTVTNKKKICEQLENATFGGYTSKDACDCSAGGGGGGRVIDIIPAGDKKADVIITPGGGGGDDDDGGGGDGGDGGGIGTGAIIGIAVAAAAIVALLLLGLIVLVMVRRKKGHRRTVVRAGPSPVVVAGRTSASPVVRPRRASPVATATANNRSPLASSHRHQGSSPVRTAPLMRGSVAAPHTANRRRISASRQTSGVRTSTAIRSTSANHRRTSQQRNDSLRRRRMSRN